MRRTTEGSDWTRLWTKNTWPPRASSRSMASLTTGLPNRRTYVSTGRRSSGAVSMTDMSRTPDSDM